MPKRDIVVFKKAPLNYEHEFEVWTDLNFSDLMTIEGIVHVEKCGYPKRFFVKFDLRYSRRSIQQNIRRAAKGG